MLYAIATAALVTILDGGCSTPSESGNTSKSAVVVPPMQLPGQTPPAYPVVARRIGMQGKVVIRVTVDATGKGSDTQVIQSSGHSLLDQTALETVKTWNF
ncbi:energy transducer TonB [Diaphorobacter sp. HDW4A]|uniref:energy transducer TonB n=1 Tax=Diaphorobacter sp. HDW4A TaxID=2714924 RepID=UPI001F105551|nr:energy transducer TonB [Diaphorobacter sp. HDW4A]